jgi:anaerobic magnesium-protoporphyrin IX monomethyl ester cyclase
MLLVHRIQTDGGFLVVKRRSLRMKRVEPLGLEYLKAALRAAGREGIILDEALDPAAVQALPEAVAESGADAVGFYTNDGITSTVCEDIRRLRAAGCELPIVVGGPAASEPLVFLEAGADLAAIGEGEKTVVEIMEWVEGRREKSALRGVAWLEGGKVHFAPDQELIQDLDTIPFPDRSHAGPHDYYDRWYPVARTPFATAIFARGCPYRCTFCSSPFHWGKKTRLRSVGNALDELEWLATERGVKFVSFKDDIFGLKPQWLSDFCRGMIERRLDIRWSCNLEPRSAQSDPYRILGEMREAGCAAIVIGLQAVDPETLRRVSRRPSDPQYVARLIDAGRSHGIMTVAELIFGLPDSTWEGDQLALDWALAARPHLAGIYSLIQIPGSPILQEFRGAEVSGHQDNHHAREHARTASRVFHTDPLLMAEFAGLILRENPRWFLGLMRDVPSLLERVGIELPSLGGEA